MRKAQLHNERMDTSKTHIKTRSRGEVVFKDKNSMNKVIESLKTKNPLYLFT